MALVFKQMITDAPMKVNGSTTKEMDPVLKFIKTGIITVENLKTTMQTEKVLISGPIKRSLKVNG